ncbi:MAG: dialkylresorcinol condensing enzyme [Psychromonas sp.]|nr:dialkylresorcinol condensing enzyme [Psychromonas sp.]
MKKVLVLYYSQSGQLSKMAESVTAPLLNNPDIEIDYCAIRPVKAYPYPWPFYEFFDAFPEAIDMSGCPVLAIDNKHDDYDLIIVAYSVWFLAPATPITGFLQTAQAKSLFKNKPVITLIACRDMWVMAQEKMKVLLTDLKANLIDNVALTDQGGSLYAFITTPRWLLTGKKDPFWCFPAAGVSEQDLQKSSRFGERLKQALLNDQEKDGVSLLQNMGAVSVDGKLIAAEKVATRSFFIWGKLIKKAGKPGSFARKVMITIYALFLFTLVLTVVPLNILIRRLIYPFTKNKIEQSVREYEKPSGR